MENYNKLTFYTDGACSGNPGPGGFGVIRLSRAYSQTMTEYIERLSLPYYYSEYFKNTTNNRMELIAVIHVLKLMINEPEYFYEIYSDSAYVVNICNDWIWKWAANGWKRAKNKPIENLDLIIELHTLLIMEESRGHKLQFKIKKCPGHSGILENELADALAAKNENKFKKLIKDNRILLDF